MFVPLEWVKFAPLSRQTVEGVKCPLLSLACWTRPGAQMDGLPSQIQPLGHSEMKPETSHTQVQKLEMCQYSISGYLGIPQ